MTPETFSKIQSKIAELRMARDEFNAAVVSAANDLVPLAHAHNGLVGELERLGAVETPGDGKAITAHISTGIIYRPNPELGNFHIEDLPIVELRPLIPVTHFRVDFLANPLIKE